MFPRNVTYLAPKNLDELFQALEEYPDSKVIAGGQSLIPILKMRLVEVTHVIDLRYLPFDSRYADDKGYHIGAMVHHRDIEEDHQLGEVFPLLQDTARVIADLQVRSRGTVGGALAEADPAGDWPTAFLALGANTVIGSRIGERVLPVSELFQDPYTPNLEHAEVIREVVIPAGKEKGRGTYLKFERRAGSFAVASVAVHCSLADDGSVSDIGIGLGGAGLTPILARSAMERLMHEKLGDPRLHREAAQLAQSESDPVTDLRGTADYKKKMVGVLVERALDITFERLQGKDVLAHVF